MRFLPVVLPLLLWTRASGFSTPFLPASSTRAATTFLASSSLDSISSKDNSPHDEKEPDSLSKEEISSEPEVAVDSFPTADEGSVQEIPDHAASKSSEDLLSSLLLIASTSGRGVFATTAQKSQVLSFIEQLEKKNPTPQPTTSPLIQGKWELVYSSTQLFRSSPFFMAGRAVCSTKEEAEQYDWFCDMHREALAMSRIGAVRQIISATRMVSEFEVKAGSVPFLSDFFPFSYSGGLPVS
jgi:hypothetical protein